MFPTNGCVWRIHRMHSGQPVAHELMYESDLLALHVKNKTHLENLFAKEAQNNSVLDDFHARRQTTNELEAGPCRSAPRKGTTHRRAAERPRALPPTATKAPVL